MDQLITDYGAQPRHWRLWRLPRLGGDQVSILHHCGDTPGSGTTMSPRPPLSSLSLCPQFVNIHSDHSNHRIGSIRFQMIVWRKLKDNDTIMTQTASCILASTLLYIVLLYIYFYSSTVYCTLYEPLADPICFSAQCIEQGVPSHHNADDPSLLTYLPCVNIITATRSSHSLPLTRNRFDSGHDRGGALSLLQISHQ